MTDNLYLCFVKYVGVDIDENNIYELLFTDDTETFWGDGFEYMPSSLVNDLKPNDGSYQSVRLITTDIKLCLATESCCHSMQDCIDNIIALAYEDISTYDEFPENGRLVLHFGDSFHDTELKLIERDIRMREKELDEDLEEND